MDDPSPARPAAAMPIVLVAVLLSLFALHWAAAVFIPVLTGVLLNYALSPVVDALVRMRLPRPLAAALVVLAVVGGLGWTAYVLRDDAERMIESLPAAARKLRESVTSGPHKPGSIEKVQQAAEQLERAAADTAAGRPARGVARVQIEKPAFDVKQYLVVGALHLAELATQFLAVCFIAYFLLAAGDAFRRKMARIAGPTFARRRLTVQGLNEIAQQVQRYVLVQIFTSALVGLATGVAFALIGLDEAAIWGIAAGVLNLVPYLGSIVLTAGAAVVALTQFGNLETALLVAGVSTAVHIVSAYALTPWLTARTSQLNAVTVFIGVLGWGWLWGVAGLLLGAPILMAVKAVCDRVEGLEGLGELMGRMEPPPERGGG